MLVLGHSGENAATFIFQINPSVACWIKCFESCYDELRLAQ